ncbi:MAG: TonB-dependent receptor [Bacteroidota bacterium]
MLSITRLGMLVLTSVLLPFLLPAQTYMVTGQVLAEDRQALEYATVSAYQNDTLLLDGTVTDPDGHFSLSLAAGTYRLQIEFIGFTTQNIPLVVRTDTTLVPTLLLADGLVLDAVEVRAEKSQMNLLVDKKVFNVGNDLLAQGGSANEVLEQLPSVNVGADGTVSLRGNSGVRVLINGRPSALAANNALASIPAASIEKVEVITNPSARYEAAGTAGVINIILKKEQVKGYGGTVSLQTGHAADHQVNANLNWRRKKWTAFANLGLRYSNYNGRQVLDRNSTILGDQQLLNLRTDQKRNDRAASAFLGIDYQLSEQQTLSASYSLHRLVNDDATVSRYDFSTANAAPNEKWEQRLDYLEPGTYHQTDITYTRRYQREGQSLNVYYKNDLWREAESEKVQMEETLNNGALPLNYRTSTAESSTDHLLQADYEQPLGEYGKLELGLRGETRIISADYLAERHLNATWQVLGEFKNQLDYFERIGAAYFQYAWRKEALGVQVGLRNEYTYVKVEGERESITEVEKRYNRLFPSASLSYQFNETTTGQASHSRRIWRPSFWQLNPFRGLDEPTQLFLGNPDLDPAFTDRFELNLVKNWEQWTLNPAIYVSRTNNFFSGVVDQTEENLFGLHTGTVVTRPVNVAREKQLGLELVTSYRPTEKITINNEFGYFIYEQLGSAEGRNFDYAQNSWWTSTRLNIQLPMDFVVQGRFFYTAPFEDAQVLHKAQYNGDLGVSKNWSKKWTLSLNARSPRWYASRRTRPTFVENDYREWTRWRFNLRLQYRFEQGAEAGQRQQRGRIR